MKIFNAKVFLDGQFVSGGIEFDARFLSVGPEITSGDLDARGAYIIPGLVDIHTHAAVGEDASDGKAEAMAVMGRYYAKEGVTSWLPTTMTLKEPVLTKAMEAIKSYKRPADGAKVAGIHLEGPFLCYAKRGAQNADNLHAPDVDMFHRLNQASGGLVRLVTVAPEEPGAITFIKEISKTCTVSVGHTTADYDTAMAAYQAGASHATHLYNGMPGLLHRAPGVIAAASDAGATVELIPDGFHIHPSVIRLTSRLFGDKLCLISDSLRCAGMPDGDYELGGQPITMKNGKATLTGTDTLAGSSIHLMEGLRRSVSFGLSLEYAVTAATISPAKAIRMEDTLGAIAPGRCADFVILDEALQVKDVYIDGVSIHG
ncbi:MAG: N-acetylglucosamine-6-phosphate deacetylase [Dorea sp.]|nr:N-acetylglucosamine-6-phosphate deacetylase [Dorea sp.]